MTQPEHEFIKVRTKKLEALLELGIDPYPSTFNRTHSSSEAIEYYLQCEEDSVEPKGEISVAGRIMSRRGMGKASFLDIRDGSGRIQVMMRSNVLGDNYTILDNLDIGDWIGVKGTLFRTRTEEITLQTNEFTILCKSLRPLPEKWHGLTDVETRYRQRYLDLIASDDAINTAKSRSLLVSTIRRFMEDRGFIEVETPILVPVAAGGMAHPFTTHHNALNRDLYLRFATELHLKRLAI